MNNQEIQTAVKKKEKLNELDGRTWERYPISVWDIVKSREASLDILQCFQWSCAKD